MDKIVQYASGTKQTDIFDIDQAHQLIQSIEENDKRYTMYDNDNYSDFIRKSRKRDSEDYEISDEMPK